MSSIEWEKIDDYEFVHLTADLLRSLGFIDIHVQGIGPDGGLDLIATELIPFAIQGSQPFRWGIQCKFSKSGIEKSVNDNEIRDVEGVLRSDRYSVHDLRGYMLVTNRRIVQNVLERLRGINRTSTFRTAYIDGTDLQLRLTDHPEIIEKYFGEIKESVYDLGEPVAVAGRGYISEFSLDAEISSPTKEGEPIRVNAILDTGAQMSVVPKKIIEMLQPLEYSYRKVMNVAGNITDVMSFIVNVRIGNSDVKDIEVLALESDYMLIGQDMLKHFVVLFDGPNGSARFWSRKK